MAQKVKKMNFLWMRWIKEFFRMTNLYELNCFNYNKEIILTTNELSEFIHAAYVWSCALAVFVASSFFII